MRILAFNDFVTESARGELYHFTTVDALDRILGEDMLRGWENGWVSLTRNPSLSLGGRNVRLTLDGNALSARIRTVPFLYDPDNDPLYGGAHAGVDRRAAFGEEREERVRGDLKRLHLYLTRVDVTARTARDYAQVARIRSEHPDVDVRVAGVRRVV